MYRKRRHAPQRPDPKQRCRSRSDRLDLLLKEFEQAWLQYRHLESSRSQYLGFFFTVVLGTLAFVASLAKDRPLTAPESLFQASALLCALFHISTFVLMNVVKQGSILRHYDEVLANVRRLAYRHLTEPDRTGVNLLSIYSTPTPYVYPHPSSKYFSVQRTAEALLGRFLALAVLLQLTGLLLALATGRITDPWSYSVVCLLAVSMWWSWLINGYHLRTARRWQVSH